MNPNPSQKNDSLYLGFNLELDELDQAIFQVFNMNSQVQRQDSLQEKNNSNKEENNNEIKINISSNNLQRISDDQIFIEKENSEDENLNQQFISLEIIEINKENCTLDGNIIKEQITQFDISPFIDFEKQEIILNQLIHHLSNEYQFQVQNKNISFYSSDAEAFVICGPYPFFETIKIQEQDYIFGKYLKLKFEEVENLLYKTIMFESSQENLQNSTNSNEQEEELLNDDQQNRQIGKKQKKIKNEQTQTIGQIVQMVGKWRELSNYGSKSQQVYMNQGTFYTLNQAAKILKMERKTLDDYSLQIRKGNRQGFDFNKNANEKIGVLRRFNQNKTNKIQKPQITNAK